MTNLMLITLFGGMALLLYGLQLVGEGLQLSAGGRMRQILGSITKNPLKGMLVGAFITAVLQSSGATTVMLVGFVTSGLMGLSQTIGVILGADIGTTLTAHEVPRQIANAHTLFNVGLTVIFLPFAAVLARFISALVAEDREAEGPFKAKYLDEHMLDTPALAQQVLDRKLGLSQTERKFRQAHIQRLHDGYRESIDTSEIHLDVLTNLKRIISHVTAVVYPILESA